LTNATHLPFCIKISQRPWCILVMIQASFQPVWPRLSPSTCVVAECCKHLPVNTTLVLKVLPRGRT
jgi:hypothetical protein